MDSPLLGTAKVNKDRGGYDPSMQFQPYPLFPNFYRLVSCVESPAASAKLPCGTWDGSVGLAGLAGRPLVNRERVMWDGTTYLKTNSIANNKLFHCRPRPTACPD